VLRWVATVAAIALCGMAMACGSSEPAAQQQVLAVALAPGRIDDFNRIITPGFEKLTGAKLQVSGLRSADQVARMRIERDHPTLDVLWIDHSEAALLARENLLARISESEVPNVAKVRDNARSAVGIAPIAFSSALGFLYNTERLPQPPKSWAELWDPRFRNQLALFDFGSNIGPLVLVVAARLDGGSEQAVEPGFKRLAALKPNAVGYRTSGPENNNLVAQGEAGLTFGLANQTRDLKAKGAPVDWIVPAEGALALAQSFQIASRSTNPVLARRLVDYVLGTEIQTRLANELLLVVTNRDVRIDPAVAPLVPLDNIMYLDLDVIGARRGDWTNRFNREILGS
jgi:putative spermidine/putrescine transport system substrate-binding protein